MQALAGESDSECGFILIQMHVDSHVRLHRFYRRPHATLFAAPIDDCILNCERAIIRMRYCGLHGIAVDRQGACGQQVFIPAIVRTPSYNPC
jgi:hypothetical protein